MGRNKTKQPFLVGAKRLSKLNMSISNGAFSSKVYWCRVVFARSEKMNFSVHSHSFYELHMCLTGMAEFESAEKQRVMVQSGEFLLLAPGMKHRLVSAGDDFSKLVFGFDLTLAHSDEYDFFKRAYSEPPFKAFPSTENMIGVTDRILKNTVEMYGAFKLMISLLLATVIIDVARVLYPGGEAAVPRYENKDPRLASLITFMEDNLSEHLVCKDFADRLNMSQKQLNRLMLASYNMTTAEFFKNERIKKAKQLLTNAQNCISEVAAAVGYADEFSFSKAFKRIEGMSPGAYRASYLL